MKSIYILFFLGLFSTNLLAQSINDYKYVLVPNTFSWSKEVDKYQVNSLSTFLFKKYGFDAYQLGTDKLPEDVNTGSCKTLTADVEENSTIIRTKLKIILKDCKGEIVFISQEGTSKLKQYRPAYHQALREAFLSIQELKYSYTGGDSVQDPATTVIEPAPDKETAKEEMSEVKDTSKTSTNNPKTVTKVDASDYYKSQDDAYRLAVSAGTMIFFEGDTVIGQLVPKAAASYPITTTEFSGKGYFLNDQFIIEREIKGVQGIIKMIFEKE